MERNRVKIVHQQDSQRTSYFSQNEAGNWVPVPSDSILSRNMFTQGAFIEKIPGILWAINDNYNLAARGVDIVFEGPKDAMTALLACIETSFHDQNIECQRKRMVVVAGKGGSGKTTLIKALFKFLGYQYEKSRDVGHTCYTGNGGLTVFSEVDSIDIGIETLDRAGQAIRSLGKARASSLIYCIPTDRIEQTECDFLDALHHDMPNLGMVLALTCCLYDDPSSIVRKIKESVPYAKIQPVLARERRLRGIVMEPYGLDKIVEGIF